MTQILKTYKNEALSFVKILFGVVLIAACAQISIPLRPVPVTLHTVAVLLIGLTFSPKEAFLCLLGYLGLGATGAPFFTGFASGFDVLLGLKGGYYLGFLLSAPTIALLKQKLSITSIFNLFMISIVGQVIIYSFGILVLSSFLGIQKAIEVGFLPFILPGIVKSFILVKMLKMLNIIKN